MALSLRTSGTNYTLDIEEVSVPDYCAQYKTCNGETPMDAIRKLFFQRSEHCWAIRGVIQAGDCTPFFTCDNIGLGIMTAIMSSLTADADGNPVLRFSSVSQNAVINCDSHPFLSLVYSAFAFNGDCASVRLISKAPDANCSSVDCDSMSGLTTYLHNSIGMADDDCAAFFFNLGIGELSDCDIPNLMAGFFECATPYFLVADPTGAVNLAALHFLWEQSTDGTTWTTVDEGDGVVSAQFLPLTFPTVMRVTISCEGYTLTRSMDTSYVFQSSSWSLYHWMKYAINGGTQILLSPTAVFWIKEGDSITFHNPNSSVLGSTYDSGTFYGGPDRTITKGTAGNQTLYEEIGTLSITDDLTFPGDGCLISFPYEVHFVPIPIITGDELACSYPVLLTANYGANSSELYTSYQWYKNNVAIGGATSKTYNAPDDGTYKVRIVHHGITLDSSNHVVHGPTLPPQPELTLDTAGHEYYYDGDKYYFKSCDAGFNMDIVDVGPYSGGYPGGTAAVLYGAGAILYGGIPFFNANNSDEFYATVHVDGQCDVNTPVTKIDFVTVQCPQIVGSVETACVAGNPVPPDAGDWYLQVDDCAGSGNSSWGITQNEMPYSLDSSVPGQVTINCTFLLPHGAVPLAFTQNIQWVNVLTGASVQTGGTSLVVTAPGVYGAYAESPIYPTIKTDFAYFNFFVPLIP